MPSVASVKRNETSTVAGILNVGTIPFGEFSTIRGVVEFSISVQISLKIRRKNLYEDVP